MNKKILFYFISFVGLFLVNVFLLNKLAKQVNREKAIQKILTEIDQSSVLAKQFNFSNAPFKTDSIEAEAKVSDSRSTNLKIFFRRHNSPLYDYTDLIVEESDKNGFDYRLLPAIAMQESTLCKSIPPDSFNCWGWGIWGDNVTKFDSYSDGIKVVAEGLKKEYLDKGLITASKIMERYTPASPNGSWARGVNNILGIME